MITPARREALCGLVAAVVSAVLAFPATGLRPGRLRDPMLDGDLFYTYGNVRGHLDNAWYLRNQGLGHPYGQDMRLFPILDQTHFLLLKVLGLGSSDPVLVANAYYLLGFPLAGAAAYLFLRVVGVRCWLAIPFAVSYATLPWHTDRAANFFLAAYWVVPLGMTLVFLAGTGRWDDLLGRLPVGRRRALTAAGVTAAVAVGLGGVYFAVMLAGLVLLALLLRGRRAWFGPSQWLAAPLTGSLLVALVVAQVSLAAASGPQDAGGAGERLPGEAELYGGRLATVLLPWQGTPGLGRLRDRYDDTSLLTTQVLTNHGLIAVAGTWLLLLVLVRPALTRRACSAETTWLAGMNLVLVLAFVTTGLGALVAQVLPQLRGWDRYSIFLALLGTAATARAVQHFVDRAPPARALLALGTAVGVISLVVVVDQAHNRKELGSPLLAAKVDASREATAELSRAVGSSTCPIAQYPATPSPENGPVGTVKDYDQLLTYVAGSDHPLSYGGLKGSLAGDWPGLLDDSSAQVWTAQVAAAGFCAVEVLDGALTGPRRRALAAGLPGVLGGPVARDRLSSRTYYSLARASARLGALTAEQREVLREGALRPVQVAFDPDRFRLRSLGGDGGASWWLTGPRGDIEVHNTSDRERAVEVTLQLSRAGSGPATDAVNVDGRVLQVGTKPVTVRVERVLRPRSSARVPVSTTAPGVAVPGGDPVRLVLTEDGTSYDRGPVPD